MADRIEEAKGSTPTEHDEVAVGEKELHARARIATVAEHSLSPWEAFKMYKRATLWSIREDLSPNLFQC